MSETDNVKKEQTRFNYATAILQRVDYSQFKASEYYRKGDLDNWFFELKNIVYQLYGKFIDDEIRKLEKLEGKINIFLNKNRSKTQNKILTRLIEKYLRGIQSKIEDMGMGLVNKEDDTVFA